MFRQFTKTDLCMGAGIGLHKSNSCSYRFWQIFENRDLADIGRSYNQSWSGNSTGVNNRAAIVCTAGVDEACNLGLPKLSCIYSLGCVLRLLHSQLRACMQEGLQAQSQALMDKVYGHTHAQNVKADGEASRSKPPH